MCHMYNVILNFSWGLVYPRAHGAQIWKLYYEKEKKYPQPPNDIAKNYIEISQQIKK